MAKTQSATIVQETLELSKAVQNAIDEIRKPFSDFAKGFSTLETKRRDLAPKFMKAFGRWQAETGRGFVDFIRYLHPEIGDSRAEYRKHPVYNAADYLRRLQNQTANRGTGNGTNEGGDDQVRPETPMVVLERFIKSLSEVIPEKQMANLFDLIKAECNWPDERIETLKTRVEEVDPLVAIKGRSLDNLRLTMPEHQEEMAVAS